MESRLAELAPEPRHQEFLRVLIESTPDGVIAFDRGLRLTEWNAASEQLTGVGRSQVIGRSILDVFPALRGTDSEREFRRALAGETFCIEDRPFVRPDGGELSYFDATYAPVRDPSGTIVGGIVISHDVTERQRTRETERALVAEHAARREAEISAERFQFLSEAGALLAASLDEEAVAENLAHLGIAMFADVCVVSLVEPSGSERRAIVAFEDPANAGAFGDDAADALRDRLVAEVLASGRSVLESASENRHGIRARLCVPLIARGRCLGTVLFVLTDSTRPLYGAATMALSEELARHAASALTNARLYAELTHARDEERRAAEEQQRLQESLQLSETMSAIGAVAAGVAHEVRNPLFGISATVDALETTFPTRSELEPFISKLRQEAERLGGLMSDLLEYGKPSVDARVPSPLGDVIMRAITHCEAMAARARVVVQPDFDRRSLPAVAMDRERLTRVFQNLIENAIQHSAEGDRVRVTAAVVDDGSWVECRVVDVGRGITPADLPRLFEPFFTKRHGGTGLGLSIVDRIVREHRGVVTAANGAAGGAVITVRLPAV